MIKSAVVPRGITGKRSVTSLVFVGFHLLILCWLAGANDEVHSFKFNRNHYFVDF